MKKPLLCAALSVAALLGTARPALAQLSAPLNRWCATDEHNAELAKTFHNAQLAVERQAAEQLSERLQSDDVFARQFRALRRTSAASRIVPVVVHVVTKCGNQTLTDANIQAGINQMNVDFTRQNRDTVNTRAVFRPYAENLDMEFRLAKLDPQGNPTTGVHRVTNLGTNAINPRDAIKTAVPYWPGYFNIWTVDAIYSAGAGGGIILGYAQFPGTGPWSTWGLVMRYDDWTPNPISNGRTATHEMGHCFNLFHSFTDGGGCPSSCITGGDRVCDTPNSASSTESCAPRNSCTNDVAAGTVYTTDVPDQDENYMSYSACQNMFSAGQKARVDAALATFSYMTDLVSPANLLRTGVATGQVVPGPPPTPYLNSCQLSQQAGQLVTCVGRPVTFTDASYGVGPIGISWDFGPDATPQTSTATTQAVTFASPGLKIVTLTAINANGTSAPLRIEVKVLAASRPAPLADGFEGGRQLRDSLWRVESSTPSNSRRWRLIGFPPGFTTEGDSALVLAMGNVPAGTVNTLFSPAFDTRSVANSPAPQLAFDVAYSRRSSSSADELKVSFSADCGRTWIVRRTLAAAALSTTGTQNIPSFIPQSAAQWRTETINLTGPFFNQQSFMVRFEAEAQTNGNNIYLDNVRLTGQPLGVAEELAAAGVSLAPNPLTDETALAFNLPSATRVAVRVTDVLGRPVLTEASRTLAPGNHTIGLADRLRGHAAGVYVVSIELDGRLYTQKLLVR
jgi:hypothetical protein